jgi:hypothetical protein
MSGGQMRPFFPFYGSKWRSVPLYPRPTHSLVIEPFAGSAGYATWHDPEQVLLADADPILSGLWRYLIGVSPDEILALPDLEVGEDVRTLPLPEPAMWLIGFWLNRGSATPKRRRTAYSARTDKAQLNWGPRARDRIASQVDRIRHWQVLDASYTAAVAPCDATWFIDPPYVDRGRYYRVRNVDYSALGTWTRSRPGQVIACENAGASWLPFEPLATIKSTKGTSAEVVWTSGCDQVALF